MTCQICQSDEVITNGTRIGHICDECRRVLSRVSPGRSPSSADAMYVRRERKRPIVGDSLQYPR